MSHVPPPARALAWLLGAALLAGCSTPKSSCLPSGECVPTVEGVAAAPYPDAQSALQAFSRSSPDVAFQAVLEDVAWLRFEGEEEAVIKKHRAYFEQGYTTFSVTLLTKEFTQPTAEMFLLTDSRGAHMTGKPISYAGTMGQENERFAARFQVSFRHAITREVDWVRLKRLADGAELEWVFPWAPKAPAAGAGPTTPVTPRQAALPPDPPQNLLQPRNPAPASVTGAGGRPQNLLAPAAFPAPQPEPRAASVPPPATFPAPASVPAGALPHGPAVGEPAWSEPPAPPAPPAATPPAAAPPAGASAAGGLPPPAVRRR